MDIEFNCDKCGQHIAIEEAGAGLTVQCPKCNENLVVPTSKDAAPPQRSPTSESAKSASMLRWILPAVAVLVVVFALVMWFGTSPTHQDTRQETTAGNSSEEQKKVTDVTVELFVKTKGGNTVKLSSVAVGVASADEVLGDLRATIHYHHPTIKILGTDWTPLDWDHLLEKFECTFLKPSDGSGSRVTDADGKAFLKGVTSGSFILAHDKRQIADKEEEYVWIVPVSEARDGKLLLGSHNLGLGHLKSRIDSDDELQTKLLSGLVWEVESSLRMLSDSQSPDAETKGKQQRPDFFYSFRSFRNVADFAEQYRGGNSSQRTEKLSKLSKLQSDAMKLLEKKADEMLKERRYHAATEIGEAVVAGWPGGEELKQRIREEAGGEVATISGSYDDYRAPNIRARVSKPDSIRCCAFGRDSRLAIVGGKGGEVDVWDVTNRKLVQAFERAQGEIVSVQFSPDGKYVWAGTINNEIKTWNLETGEEAGTFKGPIRFAKQLAISPDGRFVFCPGSHDAAIEAWVLATGASVSKYSAGPTSDILDGSGESISLSGNGRRMLVGSGAGGVRVWDVSSGRLLAVMKGHKGGINRVCISADGKRGVSAGSDDTVRAWDLMTCREISKRNYEISVNAVAISPNGRFVFDNQLQLWELETGRLVCAMGEQDGVIGCVAISPDGRIALSGSWNGSLKLWRLPREAWRTDK